MNNRTQKMIAVFIAVILILLLIENKTLKNRFSTIENQMSSISQQINNLEYQLSSFQNEIINQFRTSYGESLSVKKYYIDEVAYDAEVLFSLKQYNKDNEIYVYAIDSKGGKISALAENLGGGKFRAYLKLLVLDNYQICYESNDDMIRSGELLTYNLENELLARFKATTGISASEQEISLYPEFINYYQENEVLKIKWVKLELSGSVTDTLDLTSYLVDMDSKEMFNTWLYDQSKAEISGDTISEPLYQNDIRLQVHVPSGEYSINCKWLFEDNLGILYVYEERHEHNKGLVSNSVSSISIVK